MPLPINQLQNGIRQAAAEGRKWLGATAPNPPVGAVALGVNGQIIAAAAHQRAGQLHAEALLIQSCRADGTLVAIDTLCVTLEPCNHQGRTPPCSEAIIAAGIKRVAIGTHDPNPDVKGGGIERLQQAGVEVITDIESEECRQLIHAFAYRALNDKPWVTIKRAFNRAGSMIPALGQKTFTSPKSLRLAHRLRKKADAILTGSGTILADNPQFTVRHVPDHDQKRWLGILDRRGRVPTDYLTAAEKRGLKPVIYKNITEAIAELAAKGVQDILVEAGPTLSQSLLDLDLWAMSVNVRQDDTDTLSDRVDVAFNSKERLVFDPKQFCWDHFLPQE